MKQAVRIRQFVLDNCVQPARKAGRSEITVRAGDVHKAMGLIHAMPAVCSAIGSNKFNDFAGVTPLRRDGPANGANVFFTFALGALSTPRPSRSGTPAEPSLSKAQVPARTGPTDRIELADALVLVSCVKTKRPHASPARELYTSAWFEKARAMVEAQGARWFILSARYGLVAPSDRIASYEFTLNKLSIAERRAWAEQVLDRLRPEIGTRRRIVMLAGARYREFLVDPLRSMGLSVEVPMEGLRQGEQLSWLSEQA